MVKIIWIRDFSGTIFFILLNMENLGNQIRDARKLAGLTQQELSDKINVHKDTISGLESGRKKSTSLTVLQLIGKELNIKFEI